MVKCTQCNTPLQGVYEKERALCDDCFGEQYAQEAVLDNLTKGQQQNEIDPIK